MEKKFKTYTVHAEVVLQVHVREDIDPYDFLNDMEYSFMEGTESEGNVNDYYIQNFDYEEERG